MCGIFCVLICMGLEPIWVTEIQLAGAVDILVLYGVTGMAAYNYNLAKYIQVSLSIFRTWLLS